MHKVCMNIIRLLIFGLQGRLILMEIHIVVLDLVLVIKDTSERDLQRKHFMNILLQKP